MTCSMVLVLFAVAGAQAPGGGGSPATTFVRIVPAPAGSLVPDVILDAGGVLHMVYGLNHDAYYIAPCAVPSSRWHRAAASCAPS